MDRATSRVLIALGVIAGMLLWLESFPIPSWATAAFVAVVLVPLAIVVSVKRMRIEFRLARTLWSALTRR